MPLPDWASPQQPCHLSAEMGERGDTRKEEVGRLGRQCRAVWKASKSQELQNPTDGVKCDRW